MCGFILKKIICFLLLIKIKVCSYLCWW